METLTDHPEPPTAADVAAAATSAASPEPAASPAERGCRSCGAGMTAAQEWCLECGTAAPGSIGGLPGWRAVATTLALTLVLLGGAGAASYAALTTDPAAPTGPTGPTGPAVVAQVPPPVTPPPAAVVPPPATTPKATTTHKATVPKVTAPKASVPATPPAVTTPKVTVTPATPTTSTTKTTPPPSTSRGSGTTGATGPTGAAALTPLTLGADVAAVYDPYSRAQNPGDPADVYDGDETTALALSAPADGRAMQVGVVVDLESARQVRGVELAVTKGAGVEVYAATGAGVPATITDPRWEHLATKAVTTTRQRLLFAKGGGRYRWLVVWLTTPPAAGPTVALRELTLLH